MSGFGFNTAYAFTREDFLTPNVTGDGLFNNCDNDYHLNTNVQDLINELPANIMRFPGGTLGNYYHFGEQNGDCITYNKFYNTQNGTPPNPAASDFCRANTGYGTIYEEWRANRSGDFDRGLDHDFEYSRNSLFDFVEMVHDYNLTHTQQPQKVLFTMNLLTHFIDECGSGRTFKNWQAILNDPDFEKKVQENMDALNFLIAHGVEVIGIEMGNEFYFPFYSSNVNEFTPNMSTTEYLSLCGTYRDRIRASDNPLINQLPLGVPLDVDHADLSWNEAMYTRIGSTELFQSGIIHPYFSSYINQADGILYNENNPTGNNINNFVNFCNNQGYLFPLWITEFNFVNSGIYLDNKNTAWSSAFNVSFINYLINYNNNTPNLAISNFIQHNLFSIDGRNYGLITTNNNNHEINPNNDFYAYYLLNKYLSTNTNLTNITSLTGVNANKFSILPFHQPATATKAEQIVFMYANTGDATTLNNTSEVTMGLNTLQLQNLITSGQFPNIAYYDANAIGGNLLGDGTQSGAINNPKTQTGSWEIPAKSIGIITIPINPCANAPEVVATDNWQDAVEICDLNNCYTGMSVNNSTDDGPVNPEVPSNYSGTGQKKNVWFKFIAKEKTIDITAKNFSSSQYTTLTLWDLDPNTTPPSLSMHVENGTKLSNNYYKNGSKNLRLDAINLEIGKTYFISVDVPIYSTGTFDLCVSTSVSNDVWQGAYVLLPDISLKQLNNTSVSSGLNYDINPVSDFGLCTFRNNFFGNKCSDLNTINVCGIADMTNYNKTLWYKFNSESMHFKLMTGVIDGTNYGDINTTQLILWSKSKSTNELTPIQVKKNSPNGYSGNLQLDAVDLENDINDYYISVSKYIGSNGYNFTIEYSDTNSNDIWQGATFLDIAGLNNTDLCFNNNVQSSVFGEFSDRVASSENFPINTLGLTNTNNNTAYLSKWFRFTAPVSGEFSIILNHPTLNYTTMQFTLWENGTNMTPILNSKFSNTPIPTRQYQRVLTQNFIQGNTYYLSIEAYKSSTNTFQICFNANTNSNRVSSTTYTDDRLLENEIEIFPNPFDKKLSIKTNTAFQKIIISDISGKIVEEIVAKNEVKTFDINTTNWSAGTYIIKMIKIDGQETSKTIILQK